MYLDYYHLKRLPFQITPDASFFFDGRPHRRALSTVAYGLSKNEGFVVITGEVGAGKTTLFEYTLQRLADDRIVAVKINTTQVGSENLLRLIAAQFGLSVGGGSKAELLCALEDELVRLHHQRKVALVVVDEVQGLSHEALEELRMLSNFQSNGKPLLQMLLVGQPEFRQRLAEPDLEQLRQRIIASFHINRLSVDDTRGYIEHRLRFAGWDGRRIFAADSFEAIFNATGGLPRRLNRLCDRLLLFGYLEDRGVLTAADVEEVVQEMQEEGLIELPAPSEKSEAPPPPKPAKIPQLKPVPSVSKDESPEESEAPEEKKPAAGKRLSNEEWLEVRHSAKAIQRELKSYKLRVDEFRDRLGTRRKAN